jgi:hypothetical protein
MCHFPGTSKLFHFSHTFIENAFLFAKLRQFKLLIKVGYVKGFESRNLSKFAAFDMR